MSTDTQQIEEKVIETLATSPTAEQLAGATEIRLSDLMRFGSTETTQAVGKWGTGTEACALSAAALAREALNRL